jgi:hypothetical protein
MDLAWRLVVHEPSRARTRLDVSGRFRLTERVVPDPTRTAQFQSFRLLEISSMYIDEATHDVDAFRFAGPDGLVEVAYEPPLANSLLPASPTRLAPAAPVLDSLHTDDIGEPNGDTPSYRIRVGKSAGPVSGPLTPRAFFNDSQDPNDDNLSLWVHRRPSQVIARGTRGGIAFELIATADPLAAP